MHTLPSRESREESAFSVHGNEGRQRGSRGRLPHGIAVEEAARLTSAAPAGACLDF